MYTIREIKHKNFNSKELPVIRTVAVVGMFLFVLGCGNPDTQIQTEIEVQVSVEDVGLKPIEEFVVATGTVNASEDVVLKSEMTGYYHLTINPLTSRPFAIGDFVKKDQEIIHLENPEQENSIKLESVLLNLEISQSEYEKQKSLYEKGGVTLRELKNAESSYINAKYSHEAALFQLAKFKIAAQFDGIIVDMPYYTDGIKIASGVELVHIMNYKKLNTEINLPGKLLELVTAGQSVRVTNYMIPDKILLGKISQVSPALDPETRTFKATVNIDNPDLLLRPGMFVKAEIITAHKDSTIVIPKNVILARRNRKSVFVVEKSFAAERVVTSGLENPDEVEIVQGLQQGDRLVINGFETLRNGSRVAIVR